MSDVVVLIPVLDRPVNAAPVVESLRASEARATPLFLVSPGDDAELEAVEATGEPMYVMPWKGGGNGDYARKMNFGFRETRAEFEWIFLGADDLVFYPGWFDACLRAHARNYACVVGTNDLGNQRTIRGYHSTHTLIHRDYLECGTIDEDGKILHEGYDHQFCNPPDAPIWMADLSFKPIGSVQVGDRVIGWEYNAEVRPTVGAPRRSLCFSEVLSVSRREAALVRVVLESGRSFRCTPDHRWLNAAWMPASSHDRQWVEPREGRLLLHVADPPPPRLVGFEREYGWLAGIYDGEGSGFIVASQSSGNAEIVAEIKRLLDLLDIPHTHLRDGPMHHFALKGGRQIYLNYLNQVGPVRRRALASHIVGYRRRNESRRERAEIGARRFGHRDRIIAVESLPGSHEVVAMTTTSGNYIANGYASRNCDDEFIQTAMFRRTYIHAHDARVEHLHPNWGKAADGETYRRGAARFQEDRILFERRKAMWSGRLRAYR